MNNFTLINNLIRLRSSEVEFFQSTTYIEMVSLSTEAYVKAFLHAAKHPLCSVGGFIIGSTSSNINKKTIDINITDAIPVSHTSPIGLCFTIYDII